MKSLEQAFLLREKMKQMTPSERNDIRKEYHIIHTIIFAGYDDLPEDVRLYVAIDDYNIITGRKTL